MKKTLKYFTILELISSSEEEDFCYFCEWYTNINFINEDQFLNAFRMSRNCFGTLLEYIRPAGKNILFLEFKMHMFLYFIGHKCTYREIRELFGIPKSTAYIYLKEMSDLLLPITKDYIRFPKRDEFLELCNGFERIGGVENCLLAIDGTEIQISKPSRSGFSFYNRHDVFSVTFLCAVDYKMKFRAITYGFGSSHDSFLYRNSNMRDMIENIEEDEIFIIGDPAFRGFDRIKTTSSTMSMPLTREMEYALSKQRMKVEHAFGIFKSKFKRFFGRTLYGSSESNIKFILCAFFIHNWIIDHK